MFAMRSVLPRAMLLSLVLCASLAGAAEQVNVATPTQGLIELPLVVAMRNRYFTTEGLEIQKIQIEPEVAVKALVAGEVDFSLAWEASVRAAISGIPIKIVAATTARPLQVLISRPEIRSGKDLTGKILGIDSFFSTTDYLSRVAVRYLGVEPEKDLAFVEIGDGTLRLDALRSGSIHAALVDITVAVKSAEEGFQRLVQLGDIIDLPVFGIAVTAKKLATQREQIKKFIRATLRGARFIKQNRADTLRIIQRYVHVTPPQAARVYGAVVGSFTDDGMISNRALALSVRRAREGFPIVNDPLLSQVADWSLVREILADRRKIPFWLKQYDP